MLAIPMTEQRAETALRWVFAVLAGLTGLALAGHIILMLRARHEFTQVESIVAIQSLKLLRGEALYGDLQQYPFTVAAYGPIFYSLSAGLRALGLPVLLGGRLISLAGLIGVLVVCWRLLGIYVSNRYAVWAGFLLVASAPIVVAWGTTGQVDMLALFFALAALYLYSLFRARGRSLHLFGAGACLIAVLLTKQNMLASAAAIVLLLFLEDRRRAVRFALVTGLCGAALVLAINAATGGHYLDNAVRANLNPMSAGKLLRHGSKVLAFGGCMLLVVAASLRRAVRGGLHPLHAYLGTSAVFLAITAAKIGSDTNYEIETILALGLCAAWSLDQLSFFPLWIRGAPDWVTLLGLPLLIQILASLSVSVLWMQERWRLEDIRRAETAQLAPYIQDASRRVLSVQIDPLLHLRERIEVEPLIYTLLVEAGVTNPETVRRDLAQRNFSLVILYEDIFAQPDALRDPEIPSLPQDHIDELRKNYRLVRHIPGPYLNGDYLYAPVPAVREGGP